MAFRSLFFKMSKFRWQRMFLQEFRKWMRAGGQGSLKQTESWRLEAGGWGLEARGCRLEGWRLEAGRSEAGLKAGSQKS